MIIIIVPILLDLLFSLTVRRNRFHKILALAKKKSNETEKDIIYFEGPNKGLVIGRINGKIDTFDGNFTEIIKQLADNSCVMIINSVFEYVDDIETSFQQVQKVSGGDFYMINIEKNAPRTIWDYKLKNLIDETFYLPGTEIIKWQEPNKLQKSIQNLYRYLFVVIPYNSLTLYPKISDN